MTIFIYLPALLDESINKDLGNSIVINLLLTTVGVISSIYLFKNERFNQLSLAQNINQYFRNKFNQKIRFLIIANILIVISLFLYIFIVKEIPLFLIFNNTSSIVDIALARETSFKLLNSPFKIYFVLLRDAFLPILIFYFSYTLKGSNLNYKMLWSSFFILSFIFSSASLAKAPILLTFLSAIVGINRGVNNKFLLKSIISLGTLYYISMILTTPYRGLEVGIKFYERVFVVPYKVNELYFEAIPKYIKFSKGASLGRLSFIFSDNSINIGNKLYAYIVGDNNIISASGSANGGFLAGLWADFAYLGIFLGSFIISFSAIALDLLFLGRYKSYTFGLSIYYFCAYQYALLSILPIQNIIYSGAPLFVFALIIMIKNKRILFYKN